MKTLSILLVFLAGSVFAQDLVFVSAFGSKIYFEVPDTTKWQIESNDMNEMGVYLVAFKHIPIEDSSGRKIEPIMSIIIEQIEDSSDVITYSLIKRKAIPFHVQKVLTYDDGYFEYPNSIGYVGDYNNNDLVHKVIVAHMRGASIGLQSICDSTSEVFPLVETDMKNFIKQIGIDQ